MFLRQLHDPGLAQYAYLIGCQRTGEAIVIDPLRDVDRYLQLARENGLRLTTVAETHIHADFLSGARQLVERHGATGYLSRLGGEDWQSEWARGHGSVHTLGDGDTFLIGKIEIQAVHTPGHTPEHLSFLVTDHGGGASQPGFFLTGDFIFVGDVGRPDLLESAAGVAGAMEPSARTLYESLRSTEHIAGYVQVLPAHGAGSACGKDLGSVPSSVLDYERLVNQPLQTALRGEEEDFVAGILHGQPEPPLYFARMKRDNKMGPKLLDQIPVPRRLRGAELEGSVAGEKTWFLDLRKDVTGFMDRHLQGSLHCPLEGVNVSMVAGSYVEEGERIVLLVEEERQVDETVRQLIRIGLDRIEGWIPVKEALVCAEENGWMKSIPRVLGNELREGAGAILDVRTAVEHAECALPGATNIAYTRLRARRGELPSGSPVFVHCASGKRASFAAPYLESLGRRVVWVDGPAVRPAVCAA